MDNIVLQEHDDENTTLEVVDMVAGLEKLDDVTQAIRLLG